MPPQLSLVLAIALVCWLFHRDMRWRQLRSSASYIAALWLAECTSRQPSEWAGLIFGIGGQGSNIEGSPINVVFNGTLFLASILALGQRGFSWAKFYSSNKALITLYAFFLCSVLWSPFPLSTLKRIIQDFGCVLIGLIILTEKDPGGSLRILFARVSYAWFPISVVLLKYFPHIGRFVSSVSGTHLPAGVTGHKNALGQMTMVFCLVLLWDLIETWNPSTVAQAKPERWARLANLGIGLYLLVISSSATSWICFLIGVMLFLTSKRLALMKNAERLFMVGVLSIVCLFAIGQNVGISSVVSEALDRGSKMSGRGEIWRVTMEKNKCYLIGNGFHTFWETSEGESVNQELQFNRLLSAHNGYLETYLNGGLVGLLLLGALILSTGLKAMRKLVKGDPLGRLAVSLWPIALLYNVTESAFFQIGALWFTLLLVTMGSTWQYGRMESIHR